MSVVDVIKELTAENAEIKQAMQSAISAMIVADVGLQLGVVYEEELKRYRSLFGCICKQKGCRDPSMYLKYPEANLQPSYREAMKDNKTFIFKKEERLASSMEEEELVGSVTMKQINDSE